MGVCLFESIWSFESTTVRITTVRIVPTPLFKVFTPLSPHRSLLCNEIVNQSELYMYSPLKNAADVYANQNGDRLPQSRQTNSWTKYSSSSMFSTPTRYHNPIYDHVGFASGIFDRYKTLIKHL